MEFLALPGWKTAGITQTVTGLLVQADLLAGPLQCRYCKASPELLRNYGFTMLSVKDIPLRGKPVKILLKRRRYLCSACNETTLQPVTGIAERRQLTNRLITLTAQRALRTPFDMVAADLGLSNSFVRAVLTEEVERLERISSCDAPRILDVRVAYLDKRERLLLADPEARRVISITAGADQETAVRALSKLQGLGRVEIVTLPMSRHLWSAVREALPQAKVSIDRFRVMSLGNDALDAVRERVRRHSPRSKDGKALLAAAYVLRARFIDVFRTDSSLVARRRYWEWAAGLPEDLGFAFGPLVQTVEAWSEEIFCYFDHHFAEAKPGTTVPVRCREHRTNLQRTRVDGARDTVAR